VNSNIEDLRSTAAFISAIKAATLEESNMHEKDLERLRNAPPDPPLDVHDQYFLFAMRTFYAVTTASRDTYDSIRAAALACYPDNPFLSFDQVKRRIEQISGVVPIVHDMCTNSCAAYTGPFSELDACPFCAEPRYDPVQLARSGTQVPQHQFNTIPIGPVLQALYRSPQSAEMMDYRAQETRRILAYMNDHGGVIEEYNDTYCGREYLEAILNGSIRDDDIMIQLSFDGAQLYRDKQSDCWIYVFIIHNLAPQFRYTKGLVIPGGFVGGPNKLKHTDSFVYPGIYHIAALQKEGLRLWHAAKATYIARSIPFLAFGTADGIAMANMSGMVGHHGKRGCRLYCDLPGRRRDRDPHYYPVMLKPLNYTVAGCLHDDISFQDLHRFRQNTAGRYSANLLRIVAARQALPPSDFPFWEMYLFGKCILISCIANSLVYYHQRRVARCSDYSNGDFCTSPNQTMLQICLWQETPSQLSIQDM